MNEPLNNLRKEAKALHLSTTEKAALHASLMKKINAAKGSGASAPRPSPFFFAPQFAGAFAALLVLLMGGTAYAAKGSVPGDLLYPVKTNVNEPIEGALSLSVESKIKFHSQVAQTRLEEAEVLASQNRLDASTTQMLESNIDSHLSQRDELVSALDEKDPGASATVVGVLDSSIAAHGDVLAVLGSESKSTATRDNSDSLASRVRLAPVSRKVGVALMMAKAAAPTAQPPKPTATTMSIDSKENADAASDTSASTSTQNGQGGEHRRYEKRSGAQPQDEKTALSLEGRATSSLEALKREASSTSSNLSDDIAAKLDARLNSIASLVAQGEAFMQSKDFDAAKDTFSQALDKTATLSTFIAANARFDSGLLGNLLDQNPEDGDTGE